MFVQGTCLKMCPVKERIMREREGLLHPFECMTLAERKCSKRPSADPERAVKEFSRPSAGQRAPQPSEIRPPEVLRQTVHYLFNRIALLEGTNWVVVYDFIFDRLRAVRQDITVQCLYGDSCIPLLEAMVRFYAYSAYKLCEEPLSKYDPFINRSHLLECLKRLLVMYEEGNNISHKHRCEMEALYLVLNLGDANALHRAYQLGTTWRTPLVNLALKVSLAYWLGNCVQVCKLIPKLPLLLVCTASLHLPAIRRHALKVMNTAYSCGAHGGQYPVSKLEMLLLFENKAHVLNECSHYNILQKDDDMVTFSRTTYATNAPQVSPQHLRFADHQLSACSLPELLLDSTYGDVSEVL